MVNQTVQKTKIFKYLRRATGEMAGTTADYGQLCTQVLQEILHFPGIGAPQQATSLFTL